MKEQGPAEYYIFMHGPALYQRDKTENKIIANKNVNNQQIRLGEADMPTIKFSLNEEYYQKLEEMAKQDGISIQDCIRNKLFNLTTIFTPAEAVKRALKQCKPGDSFTLPELYGNEWTIGRGVAGVFGKQFFNFVKEEYPNVIQFEKMVDCGRRAQYKMI